MSGVALKRIRARGQNASLPVELLAAAGRLASREFRRLCLRHLYGVRMGAGCHIGRRTRVVLPWNIQLGDNVTIAEGVRLSSDLPTGELRVNDGCTIARDCLLDFSGGLRLGENALISEGVLIYTHDHGRDPRSQATASPLSIGAHAWIGVRAIVLPRVSYIGERATIGAGAVVTRDVPDGCTYVGASGRVIEADPPG